ncbi:MAG: CobW family GTP-binding protein, partial [Alphaproteobacteria bacterium]
MTKQAKSLPVTVIGGYLGAGKTTLVNHLLRNANGRRLAILVNEFGNIAIDEDLIEAEEDGLISISGGCICCSFGNDLIGAIDELRRSDLAPDHIVVETSGVALPGAVVASLGLMDTIVPDGIVVLVDAETVLKQAADDYIGDTITRQLADAE